MKTIKATIPYQAPPAWAVLQRALFAAMDQATAPYLEKYTRADGTLIWREGKDSWQTRDGADDFYEAFVNWPLYYLLGGDDDVLDIANREWDAITRQLTDLDYLRNEYELGYDQFHQSESYPYFYTLCLADPTNPKLIDRARRFAGLYLGEDPDAPNYDPEHKIIRAPHNGSGGPRWGFVDGEPIYPWAAGMVPYGLPYEDVPDISTYDDLKDPVLARRMGEVMQDRMGRGDVVANLGVTSLITNAFLLTGDEKYRQWLVEYVDAWVNRADENGGLLPDNVGLNGQVGEYIDGKWYGGCYGWTWPHGFYNIEMAAIVAGANAFLLTGDTAYLDLPRTQIDHVMALGKRRDVRELTMSLGHHWLGELDTMDDTFETFVVPYRYGDSGWFDEQPLPPIFSTAIWNLSMADSDWERIEQLRELSSADWTQVLSFRTKEETGHEQPWLRYIAGANPSYPEKLLGAAFAQVCRRLEQIRQDDADLTQVNIHHWQNLNPIVTEALVQLTLGAPQPIYNGGLLHARLRYFDADKKRPGLPPDVAALVSEIEDERTVVRLINLSPVETRRVLVQAGAFGEHEFVSATFSQRTSEYPGKIGSYAASELQTDEETTAIENQYLLVELPAASEIELDLAMRRYVHQASYALPWDTLGETEQA